MAERRTAGRMDPQARVIHLRLEAWVRWSRDTEVRDFSATTTISRMMKYGAAGAAVGSAPIDMPEAIAEIDGAVSVLPQPEVQAIRRYGAYRGIREGAARVSARTATAATVGAPAHRLDA